MRMKALIAGVLLLGSSMPALADSWRLERVHHDGPREAPPERVESPTVRHGYVWTGGHYEWRHRHYVWSRGHYVRERSGYEWDRGHWERHGDHYDWYPGGWHLHR
jgi:WXXGXW repeat (2 copies)